MALSSTRMEFRLTLSNIDRGRELSETVLVARHPSETAEHLILRVLAWCICTEEGLAFGPGLSDPDAADLWTRDLTGRLVTWIECGTARLEKLKKVAQHNSGIAVHAIFSDARRKHELLEELAQQKRAAKGLEAVSIWLVNSKLVQALAENEERRQKWTVTVVGDHLYVDADGVSVDGDCVRSTI